MNDDEVEIRLVGRECSIGKIAWRYEYLYNVILNEGRVGEYTLNRQFIVSLLDMAAQSDLPCESGPYGNLKKDIEHYIKVFGSAEN